MKKFIYFFLGLISLAVIVVLFLLSNNSNIVNPSFKTPKVSILSELTPQFVSLRFENVGNKELSGVNTIPPEKLEECLKYLKNNNYHFLSVKEVYDFCEYKVPVPECSVWLSFDQGMESAWIEATPLLKKFNARATVFIAISWIRDNYRLTANQLKKMNKSGVWDIQTHGFTGGLNFPLNKKGQIGNFYLNKLWQIDRAETTSEYMDRIKKDFKKASSYLHKNFGSENLLFSYPFSQSINEMSSALRTSFFACLDEFKIVGIGRNESSTIYSDFLTKKHYISRYDINEYTDFETILSTNFMGKRITFKDKQGKIHVFSNITPFQNDNFLCWNDSGIFAVANSAFIVSGNIFSPIKNTTNKNSSQKSSYLCTTLNNNIIVADRTNNLLLILDTKKRLQKKIAINKKLQSLWVYNNKLFFLDKKGIIYTLKASPVPVYDTGLNSDALWACANGE